MTKKDWLKAQAEYAAGTRLAELTKKYKVTMRELLKRIKDDGWHRAGEKKAEPPPKPPKQLPGPVDDKTRQQSRIDEAIEEAVADVIRGHQALSRQLRAELDGDLSEYQELKQFFVSVADKATMEMLITQSVPGEQNKPLAEYLANCLSAFGKRMSIMDKLVRLTGLLTETERKVWGLDKETEGPEHESYDDLLDKLAQPLQARNLPDGVVDFEAKIAQKRGK